MITVIEAVEEFELCAPHDHTQGPCVVELDLESEELRAYMKENEPNVEGIREWEGSVLTWRIPCLTGDAVNHLLYQLVPEAQHIIEKCDKTTVNGKTKFSRNAQSLKSVVEIERMCRETNGCQIMRVPASDALLAIQDDLGITAATTDDEIDIIAQWVASHDISAEENCVVVIVDLVSYLRQFRDSMQNQTSTRDQSTRPF